MKKLSKLMALLLAVMLLWSTTVGVVAEGVTTITREPEYLENAKDILYSVLSQKDTYLTYRDVQAYIDETDYEEFLAMLDETTREEFVSYVDELYWDAFVTYIGTGALAPAVYVDGGSEATIASYNLLSNSRAADDPLQTSKELKYDADGNMYLELEAYATGEMKVTTEAVPCDIVLILDMSNSMNKAMSSTDSTTRFAALKKAVNTFVGLVKDKAAEDSVNHRISMVTFGPADGSAIRTGLKDVSVTGDATSGYTALKNYVDGEANNGELSINGETGTVPAPGFVQAQNVFNNANGTSAEVLTSNDPVDSGNRHRVVVFFTDGSPTTQGSKFQATYAAATINAALNLKKSTDNGGYGATVFSVAVIAGADPDGDYTWQLKNGEDGTTETTECINGYLHAVSSNYPDATCNTSTYLITPGTRAEGTYYQTAGDEAALVAAFSKITESIPDGSTSVTLDSSAFITDIVAASFTLPSNTESSDIEALIFDYTGNGTWEDEANAEQVLSENITVESNNTVSVNGFSYKDNYVWDNATLKPAYDGQKLVIRVPIVVKEDFLGGNNVPTNADGTALYDGDGNRVGTFDEPKVDVPLKTITPVINDQHIYVSNYADLEELISHYSDQTQYHMYSLEINEEVKTFTVDGINNGFVDIQYVFADASGNVVATYTIPAGQTTGEFETEDKTQVLLTEDTVYNISCTVTANPTGTMTSTTSGNVPGTVYVYKPVLTFEDSEEKYLTDLDLTDDEYFTVNNFVSDETYWARADETLSTEVSMSGTEPTINLTYAPNETLLDDGGVVISKNDVRVNVSVKLAGDTSDDYTEHASSIRKTCECTEANCDYEYDGVKAAMGNDPEFVVHVYDVYGSLKFSKEVVDSDTSDGVSPADDQAFTFTVTLTDASGTPLTGEFSYTGSKEGTIQHNGTITLTNGQYVTINELPPETKYTVTEAALVGYTSAMVVVNDNALSGQIDAGKTDELKFTNSFKVGDLTITKVIENADGNTADDVFTFNVNIGGVAQTVTIVGESSHTIENIPIGTSYSVEEVITSLPTGYELKETSANATGEIVEGVTEVTVTNTYKTGALTITKTVIGTDAPTETDEFTFTVELPDGTYDLYMDDSTTATDLIVSGGSAQITLKHSQTANITGIPLGADYTVTEKAHADYTTTVPDNYTGTIVAQTAVAFVNTYKYGSLTITKSGLDLTLDPNAQTMYRVVCTANGIDMTVVVEGNSSVTINHLPLGEYIVTELTDWSWRYKTESENPQKDAITATENASVAFVNKRETTQWLDGEHSAKNKFDAVGSEDTTVTE